MEKNRKKGLLTAILILMVVIVVAAFVVLKLVQNKLNSFETVNSTDLDLTTVEDGTYTGSADGFIVKAEVEVTVKDHVITDINLLSHDSGKGQPAEVIVEEIVKQNSLEVDGVSGATHSSNIIKTAIYNALKNQ
ncbi:FMN-binding protein [Mobilitalea sibirica]|uniref:FMN-binding protein n=1 Tax=Mobilitalea sibirica TaxID=1462919 RepID=A0A8J7HDI6_9FIRM|nr:FMN-binding protein [Mobilitalea sibirica]MBH1942112.1 FMN-binding protein [Mobilitalea sibirica]